METGLSISPATNSRKLKKKKKKNNRSTKSVFVIFFGRGESSFERDRKIVKFIYETTCGKSLPLCEIHSERALSKFMLKFISHLLKYIPVERSLIKIN